MRGSPSYSHNFTEQPWALSLSPTCPIPHPLSSYFMPCMPAFMLLCFWVFLLHLTLPHLSASLPFSHTLSSISSHPQLHTNILFYSTPTLACCTDYSSLIPQFMQSQHSLYNTVLSYSNKQINKNKNTYSTGIQMPIKNNEWIPLISIKPCELQKGSAETI